MFLCFRFDHWYTRTYGMLIRGWWYYGLQFPFKKAFEMWWTWNSRLQDDASTYESDFRHHRSSACRIKTRQVKKTEVNCSIVSAIGGKQRGDCLTSGICWLHNRSGLTDNCGFEVPEPIPWYGFSNVTVFLIENQIYTAFSPFEAYSIPL